MTGSKLFILLLTFSCLTACKRLHQLTDSDYKWMPYTGNETLIFASNNGDTDTIFFLRKDTMTAYPEAQNPFGVTYEIVSIFCRHSDPSSPGKKHRYLENSFFTIRKGKDSKGELSIGLLAKDAAFYRQSSLPIDSLNNAKPSFLQTMFNNYDDIYVINSEDYLGFLSHRSNYVTKVYWSKSQGLIRFDKSDSLYWELKEKYSP